MHRGLKGIAENRNWLLGVLKYGVEHYSQH